MRAYHSKDEGTRAICTVVSVPNSEDAFLVGRHLPLSEAMDALEIGFYPEGAKVRIDRHRKRCGLYQVVGTRLVKLEEK